MHDIRFILWGLLFKGRRVCARVALSNSLAFGGQNASLVVKRVEPDS